MGKSLAARLNEIGAQPEASEGKIYLIDEEGKNIEFDGHGYLDAHPEGADRGGYVPFWFQGDESALYSIGACEWEDQG